MKKKTLGLIIGFMLIGANLFAADGDLIVNGNVGIGVTNPDYGRLSIASGSGNTALGLNGYQLLKWDNNNQIHFGGYNSSEWQELHFYTNANDRLTIKSNGNIGIGTTTPSAALEINGLGPTFRIRYNSSASYWDLSHLPSDGSFVYRYNPGSGVSIVAKVGPDGTWYALSDSNLKENISPLANPIEEIKAINGIKFNWKDQNLVAGQRIGVIADEVEKVLPEAVSMNEDGNKMISYGSLISLLIEAVKEQQKTIETLQQELAAIKK